MRQLLGLVACCGLLFGVTIQVWRTFFSPIHRWVREIRDDEDSARRYWAAQSANQGKVPGLTPEMALSHLTLALDDPSARVRETALFALGQMGAQAKNADARILARLQDENSMVRARAVGVLTQTCPNIREHLPRIASLARDGTVHVRLAAVNAVGRCLDEDRVNEDDPVALAILEAAIRDRSESVRVDAAFYLAFLGRDRIARPILIEASRDRDISLSSTANLGLGFLGDQDEQAIVRLQEVASIAGPRGKIGKKAIDLLRHFLESRDSQQRVFR
jgi:HEAT repeat protein